MNNLMLIGKVVQNVTEDNNYIVIEVNRKKNNEDKSFEIDLFDCYLSTTISNCMKDYCKVGSVVGVRGKLQNKYTDDGKRYNVVIGETVTFLNSTS